MVFSDFERLVKDYQNVGSSLEDFQELNFVAQLIIQVCSRIGCGASAFDVLRSCRKWLMFK